MIRERRAGLPSDTTATAIGFDAEGRPHVLAWTHGCCGVPCWSALGFAEPRDARGDLMPTVRFLRDGLSGLIVEHEVVETR